MIGLLFLLASVVSADEAPHAPALAASNWPIAHSSTWNSDVSTLPGPSRTAKSVQLLINGENVTDMYEILQVADPITLVQSPTSGYVWGSSVSSVFQLHVDGDNMSVINTLFRDMNFEYHGAYCLLAKDGTYFAASRTSIQAYNNKVPFDFTTPIVMTAEYFVTDMEDDEHIVGLTMTHDEVDRAHLIYATTRGQVGGISLDFTHATNRVTIPGIESVELPDHFVSNSIAMDGPEGGIYVCTSNSLARVQWSDATQSLSLAWNTVYGSGYDEWFWGRLGPGCGTSPTLMGPTGKPEYVVITDGETPMNIRFYDVHSGENVATHPVTFGTSLNTTTDQSIVVMGYRAVVVNNWIADSVTPLCSEWFASTNASVALKHECPFLFGAYVNGIEQFEIDPATNAVISSWQIVTLHAHHLFLWFRKLLTHCIASANVLRNLVETLTRLNLLTGIRVNRCIIQRLAAHY